MYFVAKSDQKPNTKNERNNNDKNLKVFLFAMLVLKNQSIFHSTNQKVFAAICIDFLCTDTGKRWILNLALLYLLEKSWPMFSGRSVIFVILKFMFSKKATKFGKILTVNLTFCSFCQIDGEDFVNFCGLLGKYEL